MFGGKSDRAHRPRELRRRVLAPARLRDGAFWSDACILNISSRGLLIRTARPLEPGRDVQVCRGSHMILARVVWRNGVKTGLQAEERVPVEEIVASDDAPAEPVIATGERRRHGRSHERNRFRARAIEFGSIVGIATVLAIATFSMVEETLARPLALVAAALGR